MYQNDELVNKVPVTVLTSFAVPITLSAGIGFGVVFISLANGFNVDLYSYLFGSIVAITRSDMYTVLVTAVFVLSVILLLYKVLFSLSFDEENAKINGIASKGVNLIFTVLLALVIASSIRIVGILLVSSLIVIPVAASMKIARLTPSDEPTQKELQEIITFAKENHVKYILFETLVTGKVAEMVQKEIGAEALVLNPLEGLTEDEISKGKDYFAVMRENLQSLKTALDSK